MEESLKAVPAGALSDFDLFKERLDLFVAFHGDSDGITLMFEHDVEEGLRHFVVNVALQLIENEAQNEDKLDPVVFDAQRVHLKVDC